MSVRVPIGALLVAVSLLVSPACEGCGGGCGSGDVLARLERARGQVERDTAHDPPAWQVADAGAEFREGDGLRTGSDAEAIVEVIAAGNVALRADTTIRFRSRMDGRQAQFDVAAGEATLEVGDAPVTISTAFGMATLEPGTRVAMARTDRGTRYRVDFGQAAFDAEDGQRIEVPAGRAITVGIGKAEMDLEVPVADAPSAESPSPPAEPAESSGAIAARVQGAVRVRASDADEWRDLEAGDARVAPRSELELTETDSRVELERGKQRAVLSGRGTHRIGGADEPLVSTQSGRLTVRTQDEDATIRVPGGSIVVRGADGGSDAEVDVAKDGTRVRALKGEVETRFPDGSRTLGEGEELALTGGGEPQDVDKQASEEGGDELLPSLPHHDLLVPAGQTFFVYDPAPPTAVAFRLPASCKGDGAVRIDGRTVGGKQQVSVPLEAGTYTYSAHCVVDGTLGKIVKRGRVRVLQSTGTRPLPKTAPRSVLAADGRHYTVMYQSLEPTIVLHWPRAPAASKYVLHAKSGARRRKFSSARPRVTLRSGKLREGTHKVFFAALGTGGKRSAETTIEVAFDDRAPTAYITAPRLASFVPGSEVRVAGVATAGSRVTVGDTRLPLDRKHRFRGTIETTAGQRAIAIRFQHRRRGIRYYLRRAAGTP